MAGAGRLRTGCLEIKDNQKRTYQKRYDQELRHATWRRLADAAELHSALRDFWPQVKYLEFLPILLKRPFDVQPESPVANLAVPVS